MTVLKIRASQLREAVRPVAPLAATNPGAPTVLTHVHLWTGDGHLYAACTDTVVAGVERTPVQGAEPGFETCVDVADLGRHIELVAPKGVGYDPTLVLEATPSGLVVQCEPFDTTHPSATFHLQAIDASKAPSVPAMIAKATTEDTPPGVVDVALRVNLLARFSAAGGDEPLRFRFVDTKRPILVSAGQSFAGLVMPAQLARTVDAPGQNEWIDAVGGGES